MFVRNSHLCLTRVEVAALLAHASADIENRPNLCCIGMFPSSGHAVACDGHRLAALATKDGVVPHDGIDYVVPLVAFDTAKKACPPKGIIAIVSGQIDVYPDAETLPLPGMELASIPFTPSRLEFPPWQCTMPAPNATFAGVPAIGLNAFYLATLAAVAKAQESVSGSEPMIMHVPKCALDPLLFVLGNWRVVVMPIKTDDDKAAHSGAD